MAVIMDAKARALAEEQRRIREGEEIARAELIRTTALGGKGKKAHKVKEPTPGLDTLIDPAKPFTLRWKDRVTKKPQKRLVMLEPMDVGLLIQFCKVADPFIDELIGYFKQGEVLLGSLMSKHGEGFVAAVGIAAGVEPEVMSALEFDMLMNLAGKVIVVNVDFFRRRLRELMAVWGQAIQRVQTLQLAGSTASTSSRGTAADGSKF